MTGDEGYGWRWLLGAGALLTFGFFLFSLREILNPFLLFWVLLALLAPFRGRPGVIAILVASAALTVVWLALETGFLLAPFVLALVVAYVLDPVVDRLSAGKIPRWAAISILGVPGVGAVALAIFVGVPALWEQTVELAGALPAAADRAAQWVEGLGAGLQSVDLPLLDEEAVAASAVQTLESIDAERVTAFVEARAGDVARWAWSGVLGVGRGLGAAITIVGYIVLTPVLAFYLLRDYDLLTAKVASLVPPQRRDSVVSFFREYDSLLSRYLRGQLTVALIVGTITALGLEIAGIPYAFLLGATVAVFGLIPYLGLVLSLIPAVIVAVVTGPVVASLVKVAVVYGIAQALEGSVISPRIVGESVGLHPVWVVFALAVSGFYFGFVGLLVAVPLAVGLKLLIVRAVERYRASPAFLRGSREDATIG